MLSTSASGSIQVSRLTESFFHGAESDLKFRTLPFPDISRSPLEYRIASTSSGFSLPILYLTLSSRSISTVISALISGYALEETSTVTLWPCAGTLASDTLYVSASRSCFFFPDIPYTRKFFLKSYFRQHSFSLQLPP